MSSNYIEFIHDQSDVMVSDTFDNVSFNDRYYTFDIITKDFFPYDGWYTYYRYEDDTKATLIENGKIFLDDPKQNTVYNKADNEKIIYQR